MCPRQTPHRTYPDLLRGMCAHVPVSLSSSFCHFRRINNVSLSLLLFLSLSLTFFLAVHPKYKVGCEVLTKGQYGTVRYVGQVEFSKENSDWLGVELENPGTSFGAHTTHTHRHTRTHIYAQKLIHMPTGTHTNVYTHTSQLETLTAARRGSRTGSAGATTACSLTCPRT